MLEDEHAPRLGLDVQPPLLVVGEEGRGAPDQLGSLRLGLGVVEVQVDGEVGADVSVWVCRVDIRRVTVCCIRSVLHIEEEK